MAERDQGGSEEAEVGRRQPIKVKVYNPTRESIQGSIRDVMWWHESLYDNLSVALKNYHRRGEVWTTLLPGRSWVVHMPGRPQEPWYFYAEYGDE